MGRFLRRPTLRHGVRWRVAHHAVGLGHVYRGRFSSAGIGAAGDQRTSGAAMRRGGLGGGDGQSDGLEHTVRREASPYPLRCRTIDGNGQAQPMPRPIGKSGVVVIQQVSLAVA